MSGKSQTIEEVTGMFPDHPRVSRLINIGNHKHLRSSGICTVGDLSGTLATVLLVTSTLNCLAPVPHSLPPRQTKMAYLSDDVHGNFPNISAKSGTVRKQWLFTIHLGKPFGSRFGQLVSKIPYCDIPFGTGVYHLHKSLPFTERVWNWYQR